MKNKIIICLIFILLGVGNLKANCEHRFQNVSPDEFYKKQKEFITKEANLSPKESDAFFKVYVELQNIKRGNHKEMSELMRKAREELTEKEYDDILVRMYQLKKENADLDLQYYYKYTDILPKSKIYQIIRAESKFQRQIIRGMHHKQNRQGQGRNNRGK